jgi:hypothetical protein
VADISFLPHNQPETLIFLLKQQTKYVQDDDQVKSSGSQTLSSFLFVGIQ